MENTTKEVYLMNPETGSVDTVEGWISDMEASAPEYELWGESREAAVAQINNLGEVRKVKGNGWMEVPFGECNFNGISK